ncbi:UNVERIFIED_CONTAM: hypothetical protein RMT77_006845 [Armadillidium vulgare]
METHIKLLSVLLLAAVSYALPRAYPVAIAIPPGDVYAAPVIQDGYGAPVLDAYGPPAHDDYGPPVHDGYGAHGRVKIQAYRGPNKEKVGYEYFAPWGYYATQPEDLKIVKGGYH